MAKQKSHQGKKRIATADKMCCSQHADASVQTEVTLPHAHRDVLWTASSLSPVADFEEDDMSVTIENSAGGPSVLDIDAIEEETIDTLDQQPPLTRLATTDTPDKRLPTTDTLDYPQPNKKKQKKQRRKTQKLGGEVSSTTSTASHSSTATSTNPSPIVSPRTIPPAWALAVAVGLITTLGVESSNDEGSPTSSFLGPPACALAVSGGLFTTLGVATAHGTSASKSAVSSDDCESRVASPGVGEVEKHPVGAVSGPGIARVESFDHLRDNAHFFDHLRDNEHFAHFSDSLEMHSTTQLSDETSIFQSHSLDVHSIIFQSHLIQHLDSRELQQT